MSVSVVFNSWKRQKNLPIIVETLAKSPLIKEIFICDSNPNIRLDSRTFNEPKLTIFDTSRNLGLSTRWMMGQFATSSCIITQDDDRLIHPEAIKQMYMKWKKAPRLMHGVGGRTVHPDGTYAKKSLRVGQAPVICTGFAAIHRKYCCLYPYVYFDILKKFGQEIYDYVYTSGDDILMSYLILSQTKKANQIHSIPYDILPYAQDKGMSIHKQPGHMDKRTAMVRAFEKYFKLDSQDYE